MSKLISCFVVPLVLISILGCQASMNGMGVDTSQQAYYSPHAPSSEEVAVVYIYWNQPGVDGYFPSFKKPRWTTRVNGKMNAKLELGTYSVVEVNPGKVRVDARQALGQSFEDLSNRNPSMSLNAEAGEVYFVKAVLEQGSLGLEMKLRQEINEREAYNYLYGTKYQSDRNENMIY